MVDPENVFHSISKFMSCSLFTYAELLKKIMADVHLQHTYVHPSFCYPADLGVSLCKVVGEPEGSRPLVAVKHLGPRCCSNCDDGTCYKM